MRRLEAQKEREEEEYARGEYVKSFSNDDGWVFSLLRHREGIFSSNPEMLYDRICASGLLCFSLYVRMMGNTGFGSLLGSEIHEAISPPSPPFPPLLPWRDSMEKRLEEKRRGKTNNIPLFPTYQTFEKIYDKLEIVYFLVC